MENCLSLYLYKCTTYERTKVYIKQNTNVQTISLLIHTLFHRRLWNRVKAHALTISELYLLRYKSHEDRQVLIENARKDDRILEVYFSGLI